MNTVVVTKIPGVSQNVNFDESMTVQEIVDTAGIGVDPQHSLRFNGQGVAPADYINESGTLLITRVIKSN